MSVERLLQAIDADGIRRGYACGIWGSLAREDQTPASDLDLLCLTRNKEPPISHLSKAAASSGFAQRRLDVLHFVAGEALDAAALGSGTDLHGIYFTKSVHGDPWVCGRFAKLQAMLRARADIRAREILSIALGWRSLADATGPDHPLYAKFARGGTNLWVRISQIVQLRDPRLISDPPQRLLEVAASMALVPADRVIREWREAVARRREDRGSHCFDLPPRETMRCLEGVLAVNVPWLAEHGAMPTESLNASVRVVTTGARLAQMPRAGGAGLIGPMLTAFGSRDPSVLGRLAARVGEDWWLAHALVLNDHTPSAALERVAFARAASDFSWRTIRLYAAGHPNARRTFTQRILATPGLRDQDYAAARRTLERFGR